MEPCQLIALCVLVCVCRPVGRIRFTDYAFLSVHHGVRSLTFRVANDRLEALINTQMQVTMSISQMSKEGMWRKFHDLQLTRPSLPTFLLPWTAQHKIDKRSPLYGLSEQDWKDGKVEVYCVLSAVDSVYGGSIWARKRSLHHHITWPVTLMCHPPLIRSDLSLSRVLVVFSLSVGTRWTIASGATERRTCSLRCRMSTAR